MTEVAKVEVQEVPKTGRNEPCPCGSGKKYKRCCGVGAEPKITPPKNPAPQNPMDPGMFGNYDPQMMTQVAQAVQRLPKGQLQRLQTLMQKAMSGKDISAEAQEFEKTLPLEFQNLMRTFALQGAMAAQAQQGTEGESSTEVTAEMSVDEARALVEKAAASGQISTDQAQQLLQEAPETQSTEESSQKSGGFWSRFSRKKES